MVVVVLGDFVVSSAPDWLRRLLVVVVVDFLVPPRPNEPLIRSIRPAFLVVVAPRLVVALGFRVVVVVFLLPGFLVVARPAGFLGQTFSCLQVTPS